MKNRQEETSFFQPLNREDFSGQWGDCWKTLIKNQEGRVSRNHRTLNENPERSQSNDSKSKNEIIY